MNNFRVVILSLIFCYTLAGCQSLESFNDSKVSRSQALTMPALTDNSQLSTLVDYAQWLNQQKQDKLLVIYNETLSGLGDNPDPQELLSLAMLLSVPGTDFQDDAKAIDYLYTAYINTPKNKKDLRDFIRLQQINIRSRNQLILVWQNKINRQKQQVNLLQKQVDQLKSLEKGLIERQEEFE